jgi:hypothetical protein
LWLEYPSQINGDNPNTVGRETDRHLNIKNRKYLDKINYLATSSENEDLRDWNSEIIEFVR